MGISDRDYTTDLYSLLGIGRHVSTEELRYAYEQAMTAATRSGDMVRARVLLSAFEALSAPRQEKVFGRNFDTAVRTAPPTMPAQRQAEGPPLSRRGRVPKPKKWGMSLPIRILAFGVVLPLLVLSVIAPHLGLTQTPDGGPNDQAQQQLAIATNPPSTVTPAQVALYLDQVNARADITCTALGATKGGEQFACQGSDGQGCQVTGTTAANLSAISTSPSVYLQSARFDATSAVNALATCLTPRGGGLPPSVPAATVHAIFDCGGGTFTLYLRPGDTLQYTRTSAATYQLTVTAGDGELASYDSATRHYSS